MFFEMRFDLGTLDSGERLLPFGLLVEESGQILTGKLVLNDWLRLPNFEISKCFQRK